MSILNKKITKRKIYHNEWRSSMIFLKKRLHTLFIIITWCIFTPCLSASLPSTSQKLTPLTSTTFSKDCLKIIKTVTKIIIKSLQKVQYVPTDHALLDACQKNDVVQIKKYIAQGANINAQDKQGFTPLHYACLRNSLEIVQILITKRNARANTTNIVNETPLLCAFTNENSDIFHLIAKALHAQNVELDYQQLLNNTHTCNQIKLLERLSNQSTPAFTINYQALLQNACVFNNIHIVEFCIAKGASIHDAQAFTLACYHNNISIITSLLAHGADINAPNHNGFTGLHYACSQNHYNLVVALVEQGANIHALSNYKITPLHCAHSVEIAAYLILHGAKLHIYNRYGQTALDFALEKSRYDIAELLKSTRASDDNFTQQNPLSTMPVEQIQRFIACHIHNEYVVQYFLKQPQAAQKKLVQHALLHNNYTILTLFSDYKNCYRLLTLDSTN